MKKVDQEYIQLKTMLASMCQITTSMLEDAAKALVTRDSMLADRVILRDDEVDAFDTRIDDHIPFVVNDRIKFLGRQSQ